MIQTVMGLGVYRKPSLISVTKSNILLFIVELRPTHIEKDAARSQYQPIPILPLK